MPNDKHKTDKIGEKVDQLLNPIIGMEKRYGYFLLTFELGKKEAHTEISTSVPAKHLPLMLRQAAYGIEQKLKRIKRH